MTSGSLDVVNAYETMVRIRRFEEKVLDRFPTGIFQGTTHTYIGQEAVAVGVLSHIEDDDAVFSNHRCHGHFIAYGGDMRALFAELMGKPTGVCGGRGGSQHIHWRNFYSNGVLGSAIPVATGVGMASRLQGSDAVVVAFLGDGALGEGILYESLNMAGLWGAPVLFVVENNGIAQTTPIEYALAGHIGSRFDAFAIPSKELASADVEEIGALAQQSIEEIRLQGEPRAIVIETNRFGPHSKGDDTRAPDAVEAARESSDPLEIHAARIPDEKRLAIDERATREVDEAFEAALSDPAHTTEPGPS